MDNNQQSTAPIHQAIRDKEQQMGKMCKARRNNKLKMIASGTIIIALLVLLLSNQAAEAKKKEKKLIKQLVRGLIFKNLSTKKNIMPMPVPIPVPIEINEPPVYLKGKPQYVTVYKPAPTPPPQPPPTASAQIYHMPVYSPTYASHYPMPNPMSMYAPLIPSAAGYGGAFAQMPNSAQAILDASQAYETEAAEMNQVYKHKPSHESSFTDYDDEFGNYYVRSAASKKRNVYATPAPSKGHNKMRVKSHHVRVNQPSLHRSDTEESWIRPSEDQEAVDAEQTGSQKRVRRQAPYYHPRPDNYEREPPCYGFPLEINVKSRIKLDQVFPIFGNSQHKKCIKVGRPLLPPPDHHGDHIHVLQKVY